MLFFKLLGNVKTRWDIFSNFCGPLKISELYIFIYLDDENFKKSESIFKKTYSWGALIPKRDWQKGFTLKKVKKK